MKMFKCLTQSQKLYQTRSQEQESGVLSTSLSSYPKATPPSSFCFFLARSHICHLPGPLMVDSHWCSESRTALGVVARRMQDIYGILAHKAYSKISMVRSEVLYPLVIKLKEVTQSPFVLFLFFKPTCYLLWGNRLFPPFLSTFLDIPNHLLDIRTQLWFKRQAKLDILNSRDNHDIILPPWKDLISVCTHEQSL